MPAFFEGAFCHNDSGIARAPLVATTMITLVAAMTTRALPVGTALVALHFWQ